MRLLAKVAAAFAALALFGCADAPKEKTAPRAEQPTASQTTLQRPASQPIAEVTDTEICSCKNAWAEAYAKEHGITVAEAEAYARQISTTPSTTLNIYGQDYVFGANNTGATVWSTCAFAIKAEREARAQQTTARTPAPAAETADRPAAESQATGSDKASASATEPGELITIGVPLVVLLVGALIIFGSGVLLGLIIGSRRGHRKQSRSPGLGSP